MFAIVAGHPTMLWAIDWIGTSSCGYLTLRAIGVKSLSCEARDARELYGYFN